MPSLVALASAFLILVGVGLVGASPAGAYIGEGVVETAPGQGGSTLTGPAETVLTNPTFLEEAEDAAQAAGKGKGFFSRFASATGAILPRVGKVIPYVGGAIAAYEVCNLLTDGCIVFSDDGADDPQPEVAWIYRTTPFTNPAFGYYVPAGYFYTYNTTTWDVTWNTACGGDPFSSEPYPTPGSTEKSNEYWGATFNCGYVDPELDPQPGPRFYALRNEWANRTYTHTASDDPGIPNAAGSVYCWQTSDNDGSCSSAPNPNWQDTAVSTIANPQREGYTQEEADEIGQHIASAIPGSAITSPWQTDATVPDCDGLLYAACEDLLEQLGLVPVQDPLDWQGAVITKPADAVVQTQPVSDVVVPVGSEVTVTTNPDEAGMPLIVPQPEQQETYDEYIARLAPGLDPSRVNLPDNYVDPAQGPDGVVDTAPEPGTRADPATSTEVEVQTNPSTVPVPNAWTAPGVGGIDLSPLASIQIGCNSFPFGIFCWIGDGLTSWQTSGVCPDVDVPIGTSAGVDSDLPFDFCQFEPAMQIIRPVISLVALFGIAFMFAASAMGFNGGGNED